MNAQEMIQYFEKVGYKVQRIDGGWKVTLNACTEEEYGFHNQKDIWVWWRLKVQMMHRSRCWWNYIAQTYSKSSEHNATIIYDAVHQLLGGKGASKLMRLLGERAGRYAEMERLPYRWRLWSINHVKQNKYFNPRQYLIKIRSEFVKKRLSDSLRKSRESKCCIRL
ncbi:hypothetical protein [Oleiagrimonas sp. MCCC 1A03011]|uniref:hypothetical protein n=1 Tax=Oleiagrimonas sp. MCCC 1A03011 TaxID=1926883 RepID=UPI0011BDA62D|nr:hypothetical protein [Oleiagrimonas sp. MCCC 1A03011]